MLDNLLTLFIRVGKLFLASEIDIYLSIALLYILMYTSQVQGPTLPKVGPYATVQLALLCKRRYLGTISIVYESSINENSFRKT